MIGIDEIALKRWHRDFVVLVTVPLEEGGFEMVAVLADRQKETLAAFLRAVRVRVAIGVGDRLLGDVAQL